MKKQTEPIICKKCGCEITIHSDVDYLQFAGRVQSQRSQKNKKKNKIKNIVSCSKCEAKE